jgi:hypothetical protein
MPSRSPLGLIAGEGQFPFLVSQGAQRLGRSVVAAGFKEHTKKELFAVVDDMVWLKLGQLGKMLSFFKRHGVEEVVFAGGINKPKALDIRPDFKAARLLFQTRCKGDNALLEALVETLRLEGMQTVSPLSFVPSLKTPPGVLSKRKPSKEEHRDVDFGWPLAKELGRMDIGQCMVVRNEIVVAVEALEGTNATILRAGELAGPGCVVLKVFKPGQEQDVDQPSVGLQTIETMMRAGATCLAVEASKSLIFDRDQALEQANEAGICVIGVESSEDQSASW